MGGKNFCNLLLAIFCLLSAAQTWALEEDDVCFVPGECKDSTIILDTTSLTANGCLKFCQQVEGCEWFTFNEDQSLCLAMGDCATLETGNCTDCLSGQRRCSRLNDDCLVQGICRGMLIDAVTVASPEHCLDACWTTADCKWISFNTIDNGCALFSDCPSLDVEKPTYLTSSAYCKGKTSMTKILFVGGSTTETEIIDLETSASTCDGLEKFPGKVYGAVGILDPDQKPLICYGDIYEERLGGDECKTLIDGHWQTTSFMNEQHDFGALSSYFHPSNGFSIIVAAGIYDDYVTNRYEIWKNDSWHLSTGMPTSVSSHCMLQIDSKTVMLLGGGRKIPFEYEAYASTYVFNGETETWTEGPRMQEARAGLACGRIKTSKSQPYFSMIAVGGTDGFNAKFTVEILEDISGRWRYGPPLPVARHNSRLVEDPAGGVLYTGGYGTLTSSGIYRLSHAGPGASWVEIPQRPQHYRFSHVAILVPDEITNCTVKLNFP